MEEVKHPSYEDTKAEFTKMEGVKHPSYEDTKVVSPPPFSVFKDGPSPSKAAINKGYVSVEAAQEIPTAPPIGTAPPVRNPILILVKLTDSEIRDAVEKYTNDFCCYGSRFIKKMILTDIYEDCAFHYKLESFGEKRETAIRHTGYYGQSIDGPENGPAPTPWDVPVDVPIKFLNQTISTEIPHTAYVKTCHTCNGDRKVTCSWCSGSGKRRCSSCSGRGRDSDRKRCSSCSGSGKKRCFTCSGSGKVDCSTCHANGKLKWYTELIVTWKNHIDNFVSNKESLPKELVHDASGEELFNHQGNKVDPIAASPDRIINEASAVLLQKHNSSFRDELIIAQRHNLRAVPFTKATYIWRDKKGEFYVYGFEKKVYFEDYPQRCCCCVCC